MGSSPDEIDGQGTDEGQVENLTETGTAESTTATEGAETKAKTSLDIVRAESAKSSGQSPSQDSSGEKGQPKTADGADAKGEGDEDADQPDPTDEELNQLHSKTRRRMKQLLRQKHEANETINELRPLAERAQRIEQFVTGAGLTGDEVNSGFEIMRLLKQAPEKAYEQLRPIMVALEESLGVRLPEDLREQVKGGYITIEAAQETARLRGVNARTQAQLKERDTQGQQQQHARFVEDAASGVSTWENNWSTKDPDYKLKQPQVQERIELALLKAQRSGQQFSKAGIIKMCEDALTSVNQTFARLRPRQTTEIRPVNGAGTSASKQPAPTSSLEAARRAVGM